MGMGKKMLAVELNRTVMSCHLKRQRQVKETFIANTPTLSMPGSASRIPRYSPMKEEPQAQLPTPPKTTVIHHHHHYYSAPAKTDSLKRRYTSSPYSSSDEGSLKAASFKPRYASFQFKREEATSTPTSSESSISPRSSLHLNDPSSSLWDNSISCKPVEEGSIDSKDGDLDINTDPLLRSASYILYAPSADSLIPLSMSPAPSKLPCSRKRLKPSSSIPAFPIHTAIARLDAETLKPGDALLILTRHSSKQQIFNKVVWARVAHVTPLFEGFVKLHLEVLRDASRVRLVFEQDKMGEMEELVTDRMDNARVREAIKFGAVRCAGLQGLLRRVGFM